MMTTFVGGPAINFDGVDIQGPEFGPGQTMVAKFIAPEEGSTIIRVYEFHGPAGFRRAWLSETEGGAPLMGRAPCQQAPSFDISSDPPEPLPGWIVPGSWQEYVWKQTQPIYLTPGKLYWLNIRNVTMTGREWTSNVGYKGYPPQ